MKIGKREFKFDGLAILSGFYIVLFCLYLFDNHRVNSMCSGIEAKYQALVQDEGPDAEPIVVEDTE